MRESKFNARQLRGRQPKKGSRLARGLDGLLGFAAICTIAIGLAGKSGYTTVNEPLLLVFTGLAMLLVSLVWAEHMRKRGDRSGTLEFSPDLLKKRH